jgi:ABC-2 type transport system ATP-binding protein
VAHRPALLVLDEPAGGLDPVVRREFLEAVVDLLSSEGTAVLFSSHILPEVERIADQVGILDRGRLLLEGDLAALRERACRVLVASAQPVPMVSVPGCVRAVARDGATTLTLLHPPEKARAIVRERLGAEPRQVSGISFEDLFVDLVGERP